MSCDYVVICDRGSSKLVQTNVGILSYCVAHSRQPAAHSHAAPLLKYMEARVRLKNLLYCMQLKEQKSTQKLRKSVSGQLASENFSLEEPPLFTAQ